MYPSGVRITPDPVLVCFDNNAVFTITGNTNQHQTGNNNGFWAGGTITGSATLSEGTGPALYTGQATGWFGFGTNQSPTDVVACGS